MERTKVYLHGDPAYAMFYRVPDLNSSRKKSKPYRWIGLDLMQFRPDPKEYLWSSIEYDGIIERDSKGKVKTITIKDRRYKIV